MDAQLPNSIANATLHELGSGDSCAAKATNYRSTEVRQNITRKELGCFCPDPRKFTQFSHLSTVYTAREQSVRTRNSDNELDMNSNVSYEHMSSFRHFASCKHENISNTSHYCQENDEPYNYSKYWLDRNMKPNFCYFGKDETTKVFSEGNVYPLLGDEGDENGICGDGNDAPFYPWMRTQYGISFCLSRITMLLL